MKKYFEREDRNELAREIKAIRGRRFSLSSEALAERIGAFVYLDWRTNDSEWKDGEGPDNYHGQGMTKFIDDEVQYYITNVKKMENCPSHESYLHVKAQIIHNLAEYGLNFYGLNGRKKSDIPAFRKQIWDRHHTSSSN